MRIFSVTVLSMPLFIGATGAALAQPPLPADRLDEQRALCESQRAAAGGKDDESSAPACALLNRMSSQNAGPQDEVQLALPPPPPPPPPSKLGTQQESQLNCLMSPQLHTCGPK